MFFAIVNKHPDKNHVLCTMHEYQSKDNLFPSKLQQSGICPDMFYCIISPLHNTSICGQERENFTRRDHIVYQISYKKTWGMSDLINESLFLW